MKEKKAVNDKFKAHIIYKNSEGKRVPGVTTITGELGWSKRVLINWANRMGLEGMDAAKYVDDKADIGTLAHLMVTNQLQGIKTSTDDYSKNQIKAAKNSVKSFEAWASDKKIEPILIEKPLVSDKFNFGGTMDIYAKIDGDLTLLDLKTGKGIYDEHLIQVGGGYAILADEHKYDTDKIMILNIPRADSERFAKHIIENVSECVDVFLNCLKIYQMHKIIKKELKW